MKNIKNIILITCIIFTQVFYAQIIVDMSDDDLVLPPGYNQTGQYYEKDVNNYLDNFTGTWEYINGSEKFQLILTKSVMYHNIIPKFNINVFEDGITFKYKKFIDNILVFESPTITEPKFHSYDGVILEGYMVDYGRVTKSVYNLPVLGGELLKQGGEYFHPTCIIRKLNTPSGQPEKIKFNLYMRQSSFGETSNEAYDGLPTFSIPNNVILTKI